jgi:hypothetical protein
MGTLRVEVVNSDFRMLQVHDIMFVSYSSELMRSSARGTSADGCINVLHEAESESVRQRRSPSAKGHTMKHIFHLKYI